MDPSGRRAGAVGNRRVLVFGFTFCELSADGAQMETGMDAKTARITHLQDQCNAFCRERYGDISRIAEVGPCGSEADALLIKAIFSMTCGDIEAREAAVNAA